MSADLRPETILAQAGGATDPETGAIVPPIHISSTYLRDPDNQYRKGFAYGRADNATVRQTEAVLASLEGAAGCLLFSSGMAAATSLFLAVPVLLTSSRHKSCTGGCATGFSTMPRPMA